MNILDYIFGSIGTSEHSIRNIKYFLKKQRSFNRELMLLLTMVSISELINGMNNKAHEKEINKLNKEIEELKNHSEGE